MNKRFLKEIKTLYLEQSQKPLLENDYLVYHDENDINVLHTIIKAPRDSVYRHKFIRLDFKIPEDYPHSPPKVTFVNYDGVRIHPNMYEDGKCCSTILNTWPSENEKWTSSMGIETILLTFHSFLDNNPYTYEPGGRDDQSYSVYVRFQSWITLLIRYLQYEKIESFRQFIYSYLLSNIDPIFSELNECKETYNRGYYHTRCFNIEDYQIDYNAVSEKLQDYYNYIDFSEITEEEISFEMFLNKEFSCSICFDTFNDDVVRKQGIYIPIYFFIEKYHNQRIKRSKEWFDNVKEDLKKTWKLVMFLQESPENFKKYKESIHMIKSKKFYELYDSTVCEINDDVSTFVFEEDDTNKQNKDDSQTNVEKLEENICLID